MGLIISSRTRDKLRRKHCVSEDEVSQCFASREGKFLEDQREDHKTDPPTLWFVAQTSCGRVLKVVFVQKGGDLHIKTAYEPNNKEIRIYKKYGMSDSK